MLQGTSFNPDGSEYDLKNSEIAVRYMALENRYSRRSHGEAVVGALKKGAKNEIFFRGMIPPKGSKNSETGFFILVFKYPTRLKSKINYEQYRDARLKYTILYAKSLLLKHSHLKRIIGVACEPPNQKGKMSEDNIYAEQTNWSAKDRADILADCKRLKIMQPGMSETPYVGQEFPEPEYVTVDLGSSSNIVKPNVPSGFPGGWTLVEQLPHHHLCLATAMVVSRGPLVPVLCLTPEVPIGPLGYRCLSVDRHATSLDSRQNALPLGGT